ncbi:MAG: VTT domain-containing protein [Hyphomicrobiaceae bacterium]
MTYKRWLPLIVLITAVGGAYALGLHKYLTLDALRDNRAALSAYVAANSVTAAAAYVALYTVVVALSLPVGVVLTLAGGLLFGVPWGAILAITGATIGATALFVIARSAFGDTLRDKAGPFLASMADGFSKDAFNYLLFLRLVPAFPFWVVNLAPALLGMKLTPFVIATAIGIIPGTTIFSLFGAGLGAVFERGEEVSLKAVLNPTLIAALVGMGVLSLLPIAIRRWRERAQ